MGFFRLSTFCLRRSGMMVRWKRRAGQPSYDDESCTLTAPRRTSGVSSQLCTV